MTEKLINTQISFYVVKGLNENGTNKWKTIRDERKMRGKKPFGV